MKIVLGLLLACTYAHAAPSEMALSTAVNELTQSSIYSTVLEKSLATVAFFSATAKKNILSNLNGYQNLVTQARNNIIQKQSNELIYANIHQLLNRHSNDTVAGVEVGSAVVNHIRPVLTFLGTPEQQLALTEKALNKIESIRKAVQ